ncbi:hypothetical protein N864_02220 [Intrasporangium chromatireducens Q5-1]|uniref:Haloacid dehalogenase n=1 Tax=Intrasporangium chromatireducens Q5-1 TaxID=584657 RepID=W9GEQ6_9MICO|nr:hypothetical protein [Intrasporangium chromatireducens]EWT04691.1 hypothetical protein N864_02220 [Intrasporangium chromatireducens Q5-1]
MTEPAAYVFDLDGVVRDFAPGSPDGHIEAALGLPAGGLAGLAFRSDLIEPTITGQQTFEQWYASLCRALEEVVPEPARIHEHMQLWRRHRGTPVAETVERIRALRDEGHRAAYVRAHAAIEADLGPLDPSAVWFTDDRPDNVAGAAEFGWRAVLFEPTTHPLHDAQRAR